MSDLPKPRDKTEGEEESVTPTGANPIGSLLEDRNLEGDEPPPISARFSSQTATAYGAQLAATKPNRKDFESQEQYEEALGYWQSHQGRILGLSAQASRPKESETPTSKPNDPASGTKRC